MTTSGFHSRVLPLTLGSLALLAGGASLHLAATAPLAWGMAVGSGVEMAGGAWLMNLTEAMVAVGAIMGGWLMDRGRHVTTFAVAAGALAGGLCAAWAGPGQAGMVLFGLAGMASVGAGMLLTADIVLVIGHTNRGRAVWGGLVLACGLALTEIIWGRASLLALSRGASWVLGWTGLIASAAAIGGAGLLLAFRMGWWGRHPGGDGQHGEGCGEIQVEDQGSPAFETTTFWLLAAVGLLGAFAGLSAQRAGAALSLLGLPDGSFASGVLVGYTFALCRIGGVMGGGLVFQVFGPKMTYRLAVGFLAVATAVLSLYSGYENPWRPLIGAVAVACGLVVVVVPLAAAQLLGPRHLGSHFGYLYLATAFGTVLALPAAPLAAGHPQAVLWVTAALALGLAFLARHLTDSSA